METPLAGLNEYDDRVRAHLMKIFQGQERCLEESKESLTKVIYIF